MSATAKLAQLGNGEGVILGVDGSVAGVKCWVAVAAMMLLLLWDGGGVALVYVGVRSLVLLRMVALAITVAVAGRDGFVVVLVVLVDGLDCVIGGAAKNVAGEMAGYHFVAFS